MSYKKLLFSRKEKILLVVFIFFLIVSVFYYYTTKPLEVKSFKITFSIGDVAGIDINSTALTFGNVIPGSILTRKIDIKNNHDFPVKINIVKSNSIGRFVKIEREVLLNSGEVYNLQIQLTIPENSKNGEYSGEIIFIIDKL